MCRLFALRSGKSNCIACHAHRQETQGWTQQWNRSTGRAHHRKRFLGPQIESCCQSHTLNKNSKAKESMAYRQHQNGDNSEEDGSMLLDKTTLVCLPTSTNLLHTFLISTYLLVPTPANRPTYHQHVVPIY
jgi:hypothetical protein